MPSISPISVSGFVVLFCFTNWVRLVFSFSITFRSDCSTNQLCIRALLVGTLHFNDLGLFNLAFVRKLSDLGWSYVFLRFRVV